MVYLQFLGSVFAGLLSDYFFHSSSVACHPEPPSVSCSDQQRLVFLFAVAPCLLSSYFAFDLSELPCQISVVLQVVVSLLLASLSKVPSDIGQ